MSDHLKVTAQINKEDCYFVQKEQEQIKALRERAAQESDRRYREQHRYHCFRCGTESLVEVEKGAVTVDICINEGCGALHLDAGELDALVEDREFVKKARKGLFDIFKS